MTTGEALTRSSVADLRSLLSSGQASAEEVARAHLERIHATDDRLRAFLRTLDDEALAHARDIDRRRVAGEPLGALAGVPVALKDILCTKGIETTCASRILEGYRPPYDATVVERLRDADAVVLGKTNLDEFAMGSSCENSAYFPTRNPWDTDRVPGGSSGGSATAVAAGHATVAIGTDTGGSIRQPAALCGLVGVKPTYGAVSRYGLIAFASSLDQVGPLARTVTDAAELLTVIAGPDPRDSTSIPKPPPQVLPGLEDGLDGLRVGVVAEFLEGEVAQAMEPGVRQRVTEAIERLSGLGADVVETSLRHAAYGLPAYYLIAPSEASSNLARYDGVRYGLRADGATAEEMMAATRARGFGAEVKRRIMIGTYALSAGYYDAYYAQAQRVRTLIGRDFDAAFETCHVLVGPVTPSVAFPLGDKVADPLAMYLNDIYAVPASLAGIPAMSLPVGLDEQGLPVGLQIMAPMLREDVMLRAAYALESDVGFDPTPRGDRALDASAASSGGS